MSAQSASAFGLASGDHEKRIGFAIGKQAFGFAICAVDFVEQDDFQTSRSPWQRGDNEGFVERIGFLGQAVALASNRFEIEPLRTQFLHMRPDGDPRDAQRLCEAVTGYEIVLGGEEFLEDEDFGVRHLERVNSEN